jgi:SAM-dependent methyltransferase
MSDDRVRHRQGPARIVGGVPYSNRDTTLSLLPGAAVGRWLASHRAAVRGRLLDLGAGNQPLRAWYQPQADQIVAVDVAPAPGLDVLCLASPLPFRDDIFDTIVCTSVLEHVDDAERAMAEMVRVLRPGGTVLMTVPFLYPTHEAPYDYWRTTHHGLRSLIERHGLQLADLKAQGGPFLLVAHYAILALSQAVRLIDRWGPSGRWLAKLLGGMVAAPQELLRGRVSSRLTPLSRAASLGYMACASKPVD